jgi:Flp pilus assembly protein TadD
MPMTEGEPHPSRKQAPRRLTVAERYYERGLDELAKDRLSQAIADLDQALAHDPRNAEYYAARGLALLRDEWEADAEQDFARALKLDPTQWLAHYGRGMLAFSEGDFAAALDHFSRAQRLAPQRPEIYIYRGASFFRAGNSGEAIADMEFALTLLELRDPRREVAGRWLELLRRAAPAKPPARE